jgi:oxygen-dependent protoporphyrinogen oxidase
VLKGLNRTARQHRAEALAQGKPYQRPGKMWSLRQGLGLLSETLAHSLKTPPIYGGLVRSVRRDSEAPRWRVIGEGKDEWTADAVVLACPAHQQARILADLDTELAERVGQIPYNRLAVVALGYRRQDMPHSLDGFGFIAPQRLGRDLLGVQWCSSIFEERAPPGTVLLRAMCGGWQRADVVGWGDERLLHSVCAELRLALGVTLPPIFHKIVRWDRAIPQYHVGHLQRVAWIEQRLMGHPGLLLGGNAYRGVALNDCVEQGAILAEHLASLLPLPIIGRGLG